MQLKLALVLQYVFSNGFENFCWLWIWKRTFHNVKNLCDLNIRKGKCIAKLDYLQLPVMTKS